MNNLFFTIEKSKLACYGLIHEKFIYFDSVNEIPLESKVVKIFDFLHYKDVLEVLFTTNKEPFVSISRMDNDSFDFLFLSRQEYEVLTKFFKGE